MKRIVALVLVTQLALLGGCSSISVNHDFDREANFTSYKTYDWIPQSASAKGLQGNTLIDQRVKRAVNNELKAKGLRQSAADPGLLLAYYVGVEERIDVTDWGYTYPRRYRGWYSGRDIDVYHYRDIDVYHYKEGTLVLDIIDANSKQLVWRGSAQGTLAVNPTPEERERKITEAVTRMLANYPPK